MAGVILPEPGTQLGPCVPTCSHTDCAATRRMADSTCRHCEQPIGYDARFVSDHERPGEYVHWVCEIEAVEHERKARESSEHAGSEQGAGVR